MDESDKAKESPKQPEECLRRFIISSSRYQITSNSGLTVAAIRAWAKAQGLLRYFHLFVNRDYIIDSPLPCLYPMC